MTSPTDDLARLEARYDEVISRGLQLDLTRGKPSAEQLDLSNALDGILEGDYTGPVGQDLRNYGGINAAAAELGAMLLGIPPTNVYAGGNSSLSLMFHTALLHHVFGVTGPESAWRHRAVPKVLCPVPGYDRHFSISERLGQEMVPVPMHADGPDMDVVEDLVRDDPDVVALWAVPKYSNPMGIVFGDEVVDRLAALGSIAGPHFRVLWDNAYAVHDLTDHPPVLANIWEACERHGTQDSVIQFASTSKITFAGSGMSFVAASDDNLAALRHHLSFVTIGPDKVNQERQVRLLGDRETLADHMARHAAIVRPRFEVVLDALDNGLGHDGEYGTWTRPKGGYFISFFSRPGLASQIVRLAGEAGVALTPAGAAFPHGEDPDDSHIRLAPTYPGLEDLEVAMEVFVLCVQLATLRSQREAA